ncbi:MAG: hypothetical protein JWN17_3060 [Frankiales bacterium]|nr:hypothetical protein [Frankiales bacterium]
MPDPAQCLLPDPCAPLAGWLALVQPDDGRPTDGCPRWACAVSPDGEASA